MAAENVNLVTRAFNLKRTGLYIVTDVRSSVRVSVIPFVTLFCQTSEFYHENSSRSLYDVILASPEGLDKTRAAGFF